MNLIAPANIREVRSFLGMLNYCSKFIDDFSTLTSPLRDIVKKHKFEWHKIHQKTFELLKMKLVSAPIMAYFDMNKETNLYVDASPFGLSAILMQKDDHEDSLRTVAYGSRSLTDVESRYSQTEREALAIVWGVEHFHQYLYGSKFTIVTDHKPQEVIYGNVNSKPSARIERWVLRLQPYCFRVEYRKGEDNPADYMSRHPGATKSKKQEIYTELYIKFVTKHAVPKAMTRSMIAQETMSDMTSNLIKDAIIKNDWGNRALLKFQKVKSEFPITPDGIILRGTRIFIPQKLRKRALDLAHESHQGIDKTKALIREKIWFPHMDELVKEMVTNCIPCSATGGNVKPEPLKFTKMPAAPWEKAHVDFKRPLPGGKYLLVVIDRYSRYLEVEIIHSIGAAQVIRKLRKIFAAHGLPKIIVSDNGPPFHSGEVESYLEHLGINHDFSTAYWPQGNAEVERFMRTLGKLLQICNLQGTRLELALSDFLFQYRTTPHSTTKVAPSELLFNRRINGKIPCMNQEIVIDKHHYAKENEKKAKEYHKAYAETHRHCSPQVIEVGDSVLVRRKIRSKTMSRFHAEPH